MWLCNGSSNICLGYCGVWVESGIFSRQILYFFSQIHCLIFDTILDIKPALLLTQTKSTKRTVKFGNVAELWWVLSEFRCFKSFSNYPLVHVILRIKRARNSEKLAKPSSPFKTHSHPHNNYIFDFSLSI